MDRKSIQAICRKIEAQKKRIAKERDRLNDLIGEASELCDHCEEAVENLDRARGALSQLI